MRVPPFLANISPILASVALYSLAYAPANLALLVFVALVPWMNSLRAASGGQAFRSGLTFGFLFWIYQLHWLVPFVAKWTGSWFLAVIPLLLASLIVIWYFGLVAWLIQLCWRYQLQWLIPLVWAGVEILRAYIPVFAFPWGTLAGPLWRIPQIIQHASLGSIFLVSAWVCLVNVAIVLVFFEPQPRKAFRMGLIAFLFLAASWFRFATPVTGNKKTLTLGQVGVDVAFGDKATRQQDLDFAISTIVSRAILQGADLLILPEGVVRSDAGNVPVSALGESPPLSVIVGGQRGRDPMFQSTFAYEKEWTAIDKTRLVVFGEFVPLRNVIPGLDAFQLPAGDLTPGDKVDIVSIAEMKIGPLLCFEALFPNIAARQADLGAQLLVDLVVDDWYVGTVAPDQLEAAAIWRAVETGLPVARVGTLGKTFLVDPRGYIKDMAPFGETFALRAEVTIPSGSDKSRIAWAFPWLCLAAGGWLFVRIAADKWRKE